MVSSVGKNAAARFRLGTTASQEHMEAREEDHEPASQLLPGVLEFGHDAPAGSL